MQPLNRQTTISGFVWIFCGLVVIAVVAAKVSFLARSAPVYWEYAGGLMIAFGLVRLLWGVCQRRQKHEASFLVKIHLGFASRLLRREVESLRPPRSGEVICCLARILGESHDSGLRPGLDARADNGISSVDPERLEGDLGTPPFRDQG